MSESVFRRNPIGNFKKVVISRAGLLHTPQHINGRSIQNRNPAHIQLTGVCNKCSNCGDASYSKMPLELGTWGDMYEPHLKPRPILEDVTITYGGDWGLAQKLTARIKCYDRDSFEKIQKYFLIPGNTISARFTYSTSDSQWNPPDGTHNITGFRVATFSFSAGDDGTWVGTFTAVAASEAIKSLEMFQGMPSTGMKYNVAGKVDSSDAVDVKSIAELIASDSQRNGTFGTDQVDSSNTGYVITEFVPIPSEVEPTDGGGSVAIVLYTSDHLSTGYIPDIGQSIVTKLSKSRFGSWDEANESTLQIYLTLGYVVDRIINNMIIVATGKGVGFQDKEAFSKLKIKFHPEYSKSTLPKNVESGDPKSMLILGRYNYFVDVKSGTDMNFNTIKHGDEDAVVAYANDILHLDKILLHRDIVTGALTDSISVKPNESESVDPKNEKSEIINLNDFMEKLFSVITQLTGGAVSLRLTHDVEEPDKDIMYIVDQNYGGDTPIDCFLFNPIDGDGSTRSCNISSGGGSNEYRTSMFIGQSTKGDVASKLRDCVKSTYDAREGRRKNAIERLVRIIGNSSGRGGGAGSPIGTMMKDHFNGKQIEAYTAVMVDLTRNATLSDNAKRNINWPGMSIDLTINGAWGIIPGCAIITTQMPPDWYIGKEIYFMVQEVTHNFSKSDWTTNIKGIMSYYNNLNIVSLNT
tara:strand:- start:1533 stop:3611 length:2079 start_codon:yes stop_codon:yes gene_type:complete